MIFFPFSLRKKKNVTKLAVNYCIKVKSNQDYVNLFQKGKVYIIATNRTNKILFGKILFAKFP